MINDSEAQQKLLNILLNNQGLIPEFIAEQISPEHFDTKCKIIVHGIINSYKEEQKFTEEYYLDFVARSVANGDYRKWTESEVSSSKLAVVAERNNYTSIKVLERVDRNDFPLMVRRVREGFLKKESTRLLEKFNGKKSQDWAMAIDGLTEDLVLLRASSSDGKIATWADVSNYGDDWYKSLEEEIKNPKKTLPTGIKPFDDTMPIGLDIGSLTLIVADVGGYKSATMINMALNVCKESQENVLYVSLEMPKDRLMQRIISRESGVPSEKLSKPQMLKDEDKEKIKRAIEDFKKIESKFVILDAQERMTVSKIRAEIEKRYHFFRPRLVVIDYISILGPDPWYQKLAEHSWYGQMCKDLRQLGRKMGFAVLSAVQLNREAIKSLRNQKDGKQSVGSDALRGSHDFSADADHIYAQFPHPEAKDKLFLVCIKSRYGSTMFGSMKNESKAEIEVNPHIGKVYYSVNATYNFSE